MDAIDNIRRMLAPIATKVANLLGRGTVKATDDAKEVQELQVNLLDGETRDELERFQEYGFTSNPEDGAECVVMFVNGRRAEGYCVGVEDRRYRIKNLSSGEVAVYSKHGQTIVLKANGDVEITPKSGQKVKLVGDTDVTGTLTASVDVITNGKSLKNHTHAINNIPTVSSCTAGGAAGTASGSTAAPT